MTNFNQCKLKIKFCFGRCNNKLFQVKVDDNHDVVEVLPYTIDNEIIGIYEKQIYLPTKIIIHAQGKDNNVDTILDENFNIVEDLYVQISAISLDGFDLNENFLFKKINLITVDNKKILTNYIGFNGFVELNFKEDNIFFQCMECNK